MKWIKLVLTGITILMCVIWVNTNKNNTENQGPCNTVTQNDSTVKSQDDAEIFMHQFCVLVNRYEQFHYARQR